MPFDLTSTWIPLSLIGVLGIFMVLQFRAERRESRRLLAEEAAAAAVAASAPPPPETPAPAPVAVAAPAPEKHKPAKRKLVWRTAWIWVPFLIGFFGQAYLNYGQEYGQQLYQMVSERASA